MVVSTEFLSYLWGMETFKSAFMCSWSRFSSYPTYEEWKPIQPFVGSPSIICSYPTYEEWKHSKHHIIIFPWYGFLSYLWGMETYGGVILFITDKVVFLSYLWGMETFFCYTHSFYPLRFLSYLWGMETFVFSETSVTHRLFLSYLWGMETPIVIFYPVILGCSYPTYEEWKHRKT